MSADVDAAREALRVTAHLDLGGMFLLERFEAAIRAECETAEGRLLDEALSTLRAGGLDDPLRIRAAALDEARAAVEAVKITAPSDLSRRSFDLRDGFDWHKHEALAAIDALREGADKA